VPRGPEAVVPFGPAEAVPRTPEADEPFGPAEAEPSGPLATPAAGLPCGKARTDAARAMETKS